MLSRAIAVTDASGVAGVRGTTQDVTELALAHGASLRALDFAQATLDSLEDHVAVLDDAGVILAVNGAWQRHTSEYGVPEIGIGTSYLEACDAAGSRSPEAAEAAASLRRMLAGGLDEFTLQYPQHRAAGERWFVLKATRFRADGTARAVMQHRNCTAQVRADRNERLRARLLDEVDASVIATALDGKVTHWNRGPERLFGWTEREAVGRPASELISSPGGEEATRAASASRASEGHWDGDLELARKDGSRFVAYARTISFGPLDGASGGVIAVVVDASERVQGERELRETRDYLRAAPTTWVRP